jgi:hypothetical protein
MRWARSSFVVQVRPGTAVSARVFLVVAGEDLLELDPGDADAAEELGLAHVLSSTAHDRGFSVS